MPDRPPPDPWFRDGLRFRCIPDCGRCCVNHDDYSYVYLEGDDAGRLAGHLGLDLATFLDRYTGLDDGLVTLDSRNDACVFLDGARCSVHAARPVQCRTFPFWREFLRSRERWTAARAFCPGIDEGELHSREAIESLRDVRKLG